ncbi:MAG: GNAT family N-acetyltransferase [Defluviitaleaceae bacterium]|nr:GNAT family N-acetyltransferase [Defluviitaleaceae bacterium]
MQNNYWRTDKVRIRAYDETDIERMIQERNDHTSKMDWLYDYIRLPQTPEMIKADYSQALAAQKPHLDDDSCLLAIENSEGTFVGRLDVWHAKRSEMYLIYGIYILDEFQGQGLGKDALTILLDYYFNEKGYRKAEGHVYSFNLASQAFHSNFGFTLEGTLRSRIFSRGNPGDMHVYGMLAHEFNARYHHNGWKK